MTPYEQGLIHFKAGSYQEGVMSFTEAINQGYQPLDAAYNERSKCYEALGKVGAAKADLTYILTLPITEARSREVKTVISLLDLAPDPALTRKPIEFVTESPIAWAEKGARILNLIAVIGLILTSYFLIAEVIQVGFADLSLYRNIFVQIGCGLPLGGLFFLLFKSTLNGGKYAYKLTEHGRVARAMVTQVEHKLVDIYKNNADHAIDMYSIRFNYYGYEGEHFILKDSLRPGDSLYIRYHPNNPHKIKPCDELLPEPDPNAIALKKMQPVPASHGFGAFVVLVIIGIVSGNIIAFMLWGIFMLFPTMPSIGLYLLIIAASPLNAVIFPILVAIHMDKIAGNHGVVSGIIAGITSSILFGSCASIYLIQQITLRL